MGTLLSTAVIDPRLLRTDLDGLRVALGRRGADPELADRAAAADRAERDARARAEELAKRINELSRQVGELMRSGERERADGLRAESRELGRAQSGAAAAVTAAADDLRAVLLRIPNPAAADCPDGTGEADNVVLRVEGYDAGAYREHQRVPHWEVGADLGILDLERGARLSGAMFPLLRAEGARLARALCQLALDRNRDAFEEVRPPTLVRTETMVATGHLPKFADEAYAIERDGLWAVPTAEVPLTSMGMGEVFDEDELPIRMMAHTSCFRREAGAAGRDTRGLLRVHEFDKVEILAYATPETAAAVHADLLARAEGALAALSLAYRVVDLCAGDLSPSAARTFDLEVYAPGCDQWLEASSVTWFADYQARRAQIRYRPVSARGSRATAEVHTLNGSALAVPRVWAAVVETYRQPDGTVAIPTALAPYFGTVTSITPRRTEPV
ncbi:MAG: serine--tRNA ligase [Acidimicrobiales bacterium]